MMQKLILKTCKFSVAWLALLGVLGHAMPSHSAATGTATAQRPFIIFDATLYKNKPSFAGFPVRPVTLLYEARLFSGSHSPTAMPSENTVRSIGKELSAAPTPVIVDIERWPLKGDAQTVKANADKLSTILSWIKAEAPNIQVGAYGTVPLNDYWRAIRGPGSKDHSAWQQDNDRLEELATHLDALYPSLYAFYPDRQGWVTYAVAQLTEARRKAGGKPVYAFLMPVYHESNRQLGLHPVEPDYWDLQLSTVAQHADGVVIWGGWGTKGPEPWDEDAPWWQVTKRFMSRLNSTAPRTPSDLEAQ